MPLFQSQITSLNIEPPSTPREQRSVGMFGSPTTPLTAIAAWDDIDGGPTASGEMISERTALGLSTVYTCVSILAEAVSSLPINLFKYSDEDEVTVRDHYLYPLIAQVPNHEMTALTFWSAMVASSALHGNGYAEITRDKDGAPNGLWPLSPTKTEPTRQNGKLVYKTSEGMSDGNYRYIPSANVLHFPLFSFDGIKGLSPVRAARESFALAKAAEKYGARWFGNGASAPSVFVLNTPTRPSPKEQQELRESWQAAHGGANSNKQGFLFGDWDVKTIGLSPEDSQFITTRGFQRADIAAMFRIPPHLVGDTTRLSNQNHVQAEMGFCVQTIRPITRRIEQEIYRKLIYKVPTAKGLFVKLNLDERLASDFTSQTQAFAMYLDRGVLNANEVRRRIGYKSIGAEGDVYTIAVNKANATEFTKPGLIPNTQLVDPLEEKPSPDPPQQVNEVNQ